ncbi:MAG: hypothetical protein WDZ37_03530 [Solirubrobacterales bacterium]
MALAILLGTVAAAPADASKAEWSIFEDGRYLALADTQTRQGTLDQIKALGADTLRVGVGWEQVAPDPGARQMPAFDATDPGAYPGFGPFDDLVVRAKAMGFRVLITLAPAAPRWATGGGRGGNYKVNSTKFADFARAVGKRYSGNYAGLPAVYHWSLWNEPSHALFLKPREFAPRIYRRMVERGLPALRSKIASGAKVFVGELAPVGTDTKVIGPLAFLRKWLCLDPAYRPLRGRRATVAGCKNFKKVEADGFAHHPYGAQAGNTHPPKGRDIVNISVIGRLSSALDKAARAGRLPVRLPIYSTEFGFQSHPPDPFVGISLQAQARLINTAEEISYRNSRVRSYSQYLLYDDPARAGSAAVKWSGFQTGLRLVGGVRKPSFDAYRLPLVVREVRGGVTVWGRVRPSGGSRLVQLQRRSAGGFVDVGAPFPTDSFGYFRVKRSARASYRFIGFVTDAATGQEVQVGMSRTAKPQL